jgi:acid phosphatase
VARAAGGCRRLALLAVACCVLAVSACSAGTSGEATPHTNGGPGGTPTPPSAQPVPLKGQVDKLLVFVVENHSFDQMRTQMPYTFGLATRYGYAEDYRALRHPSLPNYLAIAGGDMFGVHDDAPPSSHRLHGPTVFGQVARNGSTAKLYAEAMNSPCQLTNSGTYVVKHNPWAYFADEAALCQHGDVSLDELAPDARQGTLPAVGMAIPDLCNDAHDCSLAQADAWLQNHVAGVLAGPDFRTGHLAVVVTADEDDGRHGNRILTVVVHRSLHHTVVRAPLDHYSLSRAYADVGRIEPLGHAARAPSLLATFGLRVE